MRFGVGIQAALNLASRFQHVDSAIRFLRGLAKPVQEILRGESFMIRRQIWLHYRGCRLAVEIIATFGAAALIGYWIVQTSR
jgi:hypothetical protein